MFIKIISAGSYVPDKVVTNDDLAKIMDTSDEWIRTRTGIRERHLFEDGEREKTLKASAVAGEKALAGAEALGLKREDIDLVLVATSTPDCLFPATACVLTERLCIGEAAAFDISLACTGFIAAFSAAAAYLNSGMYKNALVIGVDVMSKLLDFSDRSTSILFGDGAGAVVLSSDERFKENTESGLLRSILRSDGRRADILSCDSIYANESGGKPLYMEGRGVFEFAIREVPKLIKELLTDIEEEPSLYLLHQANHRIVESVAKRLKKPMELFPCNIDRYANTTAATIPLLIDELKNKGRLKDGELIVMAGFGAGLSFGALLYRC